MANVRERSREKTNELVAYVRSNIESGTWKPGFQIPTEKSLVSQFSAARNAVRKALSQLENEGIIDRQVGRGTFVRNNSPQIEGDSWVDASPAEVNEIRVLIEPAIADWAVVRATKSDIEHIRLCFNNALKAKTISKFEHWDAEFHSGIVKAAKNNMMVKIYEGISKARRQIEWYQMKDQSLTEERRSKYNKDHSRILQALESRDAAGLREALSDHLKEVSYNMLNP
jgi:DNA-binding FadR family transcriptional regulator